MPTRAERMMGSNSASRSASVSFFESSRPGGMALRSSTTAAATTGPAHGPRPASSMPQTRSMPCRIASSSMVKSGSNPPMCALDHEQENGNPHFRRVLVDALSPRVASAAADTRTAPPRAPLHRPEHQGPGDVAAELVTGKKRRTTGNSRPTGLQPPRRQRRG